MKPNMQPEPTGPGRPTDGPTEFPDTLQAMWDAGYAAGVRAAALAGTARGGPEPTWRDAIGCIPHRKGAESSEAIIARSRGETGAPPAAPAIPDYDAAFRAATEAVTRLQALGGHWEPDQLAYAAVKAAMVALGVRDPKDGVDAAPDDPGYVYDCLIKPRADQDGAMFRPGPHGSPIAYLRGYAIIPLSEYSALGGTLGGGAPAAPAPANSQLTDWCDRHQQSYAVNDCPLCVAAMPAPDDTLVNRVCMDLLKIVGKSATEINEIMCVAPAGERLRDDVREALRHAR